MEFSGIDWGQVLGYVAGALVFAAFGMKTMIPLRITAIASNVAFLAYALIEGLTPILVLHGLLLPLNIFRMVELVLLLRRVRLAKRNGFDVMTVLPFVEPIELKDRDVLLRKGDTADCMYIVLDGEVEVVDYGIRLGIHDIVGETGLFASDRKRTATVRACGPVRLGRICQDDVERLYFLKPEFGHALIHLIGRRLTENLQTAALPQPSFLAGSV
ncbi:MAG: cyclic nucleotide-binding domain-containing protein [Pseudomonadota bacterium]